MNSIQLKLVNKLNKTKCSFLLLNKSRSSLKATFNAKLSNDSKQKVSDFENRNILQFKDRGLIVGIFPDKT